MLDRLLSWLSPHICKGCKVIGATLCSRCKSYILGQNWRKCIKCSGLVSNNDFFASGNLCGKCAPGLPFTQVFVVGERIEILKRLVGDHKYFSERESAHAIAELISGILPQELPADLTIVPLPTIARHIRERGFDHTKLIVQHLSRIRKIPVNTRILRRTDNASQHSADYKTRLVQAEKAFFVSPRTKIPSKILLVDDIYTTGATVAAAARILRQHGAREIWLAIAARQTEES